MREENRAGGDLALDFADPIDGSRSEDGTFAARITDAGDFTLKKAVWPGR